ncbi:MAG: response regulator [Spirochaetota bacterium]
MTEDSIRILILEDLPTDAELAKREISKARGKYEFRIVETRGEYLDALNTFVPDVIVSDYRMPRFNGLEALKMALELKPLTPVIILTSAINEDTAVECMKAGASDYVIKEHIKRLGQAVIHAIEETETKKKRAKAEEEKRKLEQQLAQAQKMEAIGTLAGGIAHDFNNILSGILGYAELSLYNLKETEKVNGYISEIINATQRARELVTHILVFSRHTEMNLKSIIPRFTIMEAVKLLRATLPSTIELKTSLKSNSAILGEPTQLHQVVINLCTNAAYALLGNKGVIEIILEDMEVDEDFIRLHPDLNHGKHIMLSISDSGCGIEPEILDHIFEPFFTTKPTGKGTGLGLSVVHGIVKEFGGIITVESKVNTGTSFKIIIPVTIPELKTSIKTAENAMQGGSERILVIDDETLIIDMLKIVLSDLGYSVNVFMDSVSALNAFRNDPQAYDLIITDYTMPHLTGVEIAERIKEIRKDIPIILCSGYVQKDLERISSLEAVSRILQKPIMTSDLANTIRLVLDNK